MDGVERLAWIRLYERTGNAGAVCRRFQISRPTLRKWWRRYLASGVAGLEEASRVPASSPNRKVFAREEALILDLRRRLGLGLHRLRETLRRSHDLDLSADTIRRVLERNGEPPLRSALRAPPTRLTARARPPATSARNGRENAPRTLHGVPPDDAAASALGDAITKGEFRPGQKLSEAALGDRLGVGRALVRQALKQLAFAGLVTLHRNRGAYVATPSLDEIEQAYAARRLIEADIIADLARHCTSHDIRRLNRHVDLQAAAEAAGDRGQLVRLLTEFHLLIASMGENRILEEIVANLAAKTSLAVLLYDQDDTPSCAINEHRRLIELMAAGDAEAATGLICSHLSTNQGRLQAHRPAGPATQRRV